MISFAFLSASTRLSQEIIVYGLSYFYTGHQFAKLITNNGSTTVPAFAMDNGGLSNSLTISDDTSMQGNVKLRFSLFSIVSITFRNLWADYPDRAFTKG